MIGRAVLHYTITAELGAGAMGRVYLARDERTQRRVALKFIAPEAAGSPEGRARLAREAVAAARLSHPHIVTLHAVEETDQELFLVEEYVEGESLASRLERGPLGPQETLRLARALAEALAHAHRQGVLHRDMKPANVLIAADGTYKVADFGIARVEGTATLTATGTVIGSLPYLAPERLRGASGDARSDLFSLGAVLYEALSGRRAFLGASDAEVMYGVLNVEPKPPEVPTASLLPLAALVMKLLAKEPDQRPPSAEAVAGVLEGIEGATGPRIAQASRASRRWWAPAVAAALLVAAVAGWWWTHRAAAPPGAEPTVAVLYFENVADPEDRGRMGPITGNLLVTSIAQAPGLNVLSTQRILDVMRQVGRRGAVDRVAALEVARRAHAARIVTGSILQTAPAIVMTAEIADVATGRVLMAERVEGTPGQSVFQVVDLLGARLTARLSPAAEGTRLAPVAQRTSADLEAQRHYAEGLEHLSAGHLPQAMASFRAALARDPDFPQAHYQLAMAEWWQNEFGSALDHLASARARADRLSPLEREILDGLAAMVGGSISAVYPRFEALARAHPEERQVLYGLLEAAYHSGHYEASIGAARALLELNPKYSFAAVHLVDALGYLGREAEADSTARLLLARDPTNGVLWNALFGSKLRRGDAAGALQVADEARAAHALVRYTARRAGLLRLDLTGALDPAQLATPEDTLPWQPEAWRLGVAAATAMHAGRFRQAAELARREWAVCRRGTGAASQPFSDGIPAAIAAGDTEQALAWCDSATALVTRLGRPYAVLGHINRMVVLAQLGRLVEAEALYRRLVTSPESRPDYFAQALRYGHAMLLQAQGQPRRALDELHAGVWYWDQTLMWSAPIRDGALMRLDAGLYAEALAGLDTLLRVPVLPPADAVRLRFWRGQALERLGRTSEAAASYREFLRLWKDADPGAPGVAEARAALARTGRG
jgi:serine/threonine-protein kinase